MQTARATIAAHRIKTVLTTTTTKMSEFIPNTEPSSLAATAETHNSPAAIYLTLNT
jgi:hypothetical protein